MEKEVSTNQLVIVILIAIAMSGFSILLSVAGPGLTSASSSGDGFVNVTVSAVTDVSIGISSINFSATSPGQSRNSYNASDVKGCGADNHCGFNITNDGTTFVNITIQETENLFDSGTYDANTNFVYNITMQDPLYTTDYGSKGNCSVGYDQGLPGLSGWGDWRAVPRDSEEVAICYLNHTSSPEGENRPDVARIELNITVPNDETQGSKVGTITLTAVATN
ncbi:MAG: hypothetical protein Q8O03_06190 [Nanoarchaeota archaeon]|nr:hypothetical protein [Nanoarchaeota archaeon]